MTETEARIEDIARAICRAKKLDPDTHWRKFRELSKSTKEPSK